MIHVKNTKIDKKDESPIEHDISTFPWTKLGADLFELKGKSHLVLVDYTTNFFDVSLFPNKRYATVVTHPKRIFSMFVIPKKVISDNGPEYIGKDYKHDSSSHDYPKSNGKID